MQNPGQKGTLSNGAKILAANVMLLVPAAIFWVSVILWVSLGTDWLFDAVIDPMSQTNVGNLMVIGIVVGLPGLAVGINGMAYLKAKSQEAWWGVAIAVVFLAAGFFAAVRRY